MIAGQYTIDTLTLLEIHNSAGTSILDVVCRTLRVSNDLRLVALAACSWYSQTPFASGADIAIERKLYER